jgi:GH15 family glucan-1,4-alpha-glucosidase
MPGPIESYAVIGNCETAALVGQNGSIDWLGLPRFDSAACFAALLGGPANGRWQIAPSSPHPQVTRRYRPNSLILETEFQTAEGRVLLVDCMSRRDGAADLVRVVRGVHGRSRMQMELIIRLEYGSVIPWVRRLDDGRLTAVAGPDRLTLCTSAELRGEGMKTVAAFVVDEGEEIAFSLTWSPSFRPVPAPANADAVLETVAEFWHDWSKAHSSSSFAISGGRADSDEEVPRTIRSSALRNLISFQILKPER